MHYPVFSSISGVRLEFTFENFIIGASNVEALDACREAASRSLHSSPLWLTCDIPGNGATHLSMAVAALLMQKSPQCRLKIISMYRPEVSLNSIAGAEALFIDGMNAFNSKNHDASTLASEISRFLFDRKLIVINGTTSTDFPSALKEIFGTSNAQRIRRPEQSILARKIRQMAESDNCRISDDILDFLVSPSLTSMREAIGIYLRAKSLAIFRQKEIDIAIAGEVNRSHNRN